MSAGLSSIEIPSLSLALRDIETKLIVTRFDNNPYCRDTCKLKIWPNRSVPSCLLPLFQNESFAKTFK